MNLVYVKNYLEEHKEGLSKEDVSQLFNEITTYLGVKGTFSDISGIMRTVHDYYMGFIAKVQEYEAIPKNNMKELPRRTEKIRDILCTLSLLHTYLVLCLSNLRESNFNMKNVRAYVSELEAKKELFKSEKITWSSILRSITQELAYASEMRKMDIEDHVGYLKYKEN